MVFQEQSIFPWMTVRDNVAFGLKARGFGKRERYAIADPYIQKVGLGQFADALPYQLSGGMKQRVSIARAFANDPEVLLMDEPFAALDARTKLTLQAEFLRIWEQHKGGDKQKTVLFVTHDLQEATLLADRVIIMLPNPGRIAEDKVLDLPRPRAEHLGELQFTDEFKNVTHSLFERLEGAINTENSSRAAGPVRTPAAGSTAVSEVSAR